MRMPAFKLAKVLPVALAAAVASNLGAIAYSNAKLDELAAHSMALTVETDRKHDLLQDLVVTAKGIEIDIVSTQESLTDIAATRGLDGLDDGFELAEESAKALAVKVARVAELGDSLGAPEIRGTLADLTDRFDAFYKLGIKMAKLYVEGGPEKGNPLMIPFDDASERMQSALTSTSAAVAAIGERFEAEAAAALAEEAKSVEEAGLIGLMFGLSALIFGGGFAIYLIGYVIRPLMGIKDYMGNLSSGDYSQDVPHTARGDEIGDMARSVAQFRDAARERQSVRIATERQREERAAREAEETREKARRDAERAEVIRSLTEGLEQLAAGNLTHRIVTPFSSDYEKLRGEFNQSVAALNETLGAIVTGTDTVRVAALEIGSSTDDLSRRTEQQAAALEETAAALDEVTATVREASQRADEASVMVGATKTGAEKSGRVVREAIAAMEKIESSSRQIAQIISVIDDIAFQTNLLALNAGVEAARAGEAGKGFAVVAQEVRELAQRSANAAKEIKSLIEASSAHVGTGVSLVNGTGTALADIEGQVTRINDHIQSIVTASREQATALSEINAAINQMDQVTQQNAAMVEETNAATQGLSSEAENLESLVGRFSLDRLVAVAACRQASAASRPSPLRDLGRKFASAF